MVSEDGVTLWVYELEYRVSVVLLGSGEKDDFIALAHCFQKLVGVWSDIEFSLWISRWEYFEDRTIELGNPDDSLALNSIFGEAVDDCFVEINYQSFHFVIFD